MTDNAVSVVRGALMEAELQSQPGVWERAIAQAADERLLPADGLKVAVIGCGTSWFMAQCYASVREGSGRGVTDAFAASEAVLGAERKYDAVVAITRSGTTTEVLDLLRALRGVLPTTVLVGAVDSPVVTAADSVVRLPYADEQSVVQTRFATAALAYLLASAGMPLDVAVADARSALADPISQELIDAEQFTFLGRGWTVGLAHEAALKMREAVQGWTESYPAMEYRHGPIAIAGPHRVTWLLGEEPEGIRRDVEQTGARYLRSDRHPLAELVLIHRVALARARARGLDPDRPRHLSRSIILAS
jgi:fructoselysine-6-P-deglycase FrlB-like protein